MIRLAGACPRLLTLAAVVAALVVTFPAPRDAAAQARTIDVPDDWPLIPSKLGSRTEFRLLFVTSNTRSAANDDAAPYHEHVRARAKANANLQSFGANDFRAVVCTQKAQADGNSYAYGLAAQYPIYWVGGSRVSADATALFNGLPTTDLVNEEGNATSPSWLLTGCPGAKSGSTVDLDDKARGDLGRNVISIYDRFKFQGNKIDTMTTFIQRANAAVVRRPMSSTGALYALSPIYRVQSPPPGPSHVVLEGLNRKNLTVEENGGVNYFVRVVRAQRKAVTVTPVVNGKAVTVSPASHTWAKGETGRKSFTVSGVQDANVKDDKFSIIHKFTSDEDKDEEFRLRISGRATDDDTMQLIIKENGVEVSELMLAPGATKTYTVELSHDPDISPVPRGHRFDAYVVHDTKTVRSSSPLDCGSEPSHVQCGAAQTANYDRNYEQHKKDGYPCTRANPRPAANCWDAYETLTGSTWVKSTYTKPPVRVYNSPEGEGNTGKAVFHHFHSDNWNKPYTIEVRRIGDLPPGFSSWHIRHRLAPLGLSSRLPVILTSNATFNSSDSSVPVPAAVFVPDAALVAAVTAKADAHSNPAAAERLRRIVKGMKGETGGYTAAECRDTADHHGVAGAWKPWCDEIERRESWTPPAEPEVSISAGAGVTEGAGAVFTLIASPAPASDLTVNVDVSQQGDYGVSTGSRTVTVGTSGTATLTVATAGDDVDEPDGSVTVTLVAGSGYTVSASNGTDTVTVADDDAPAVFVPDPQLVAAVTTKADAHSNPAAAERLRKIVKGMKGEAGGYSAAECRQVADGHGVTDTWKPWCDEIERRENWTPSVSRQSRSLRALQGGGAAWALAARGLVWDQIAAALQRLEARRIVDEHVCTDEPEQAALHARLDDGDRIYPELQADHDVPALWDGSTPFVVDISSTFANADALLDAVAEEAERIRQVLGYEIVVAGEVLDLGDLEADDLGDLGTARYLIPQDQRIEVRCCHDEGDEFAGMAWPWMRMILLEDDDFQSRHIIMHELYHLLGFAHPDDSVGVVMSDSLMHGPGTDAFGASFPTQPSPLDLAKLACIYD